MREIEEEKRKRKSGSVQRIQRNSNVKKNIEKEGTKEIREIRVKIKNKKPVPKIKEPEEKKSKQNSIREIAAHQNKAIKIKKNGKNRLTY